MRMPLAVLAALATAVLATGCEREARRLTTTVDNARSTPDAARAGLLQPGQALTGSVRTAAANESPYQGNAFGVNQGKRLFRWYNCNGCHSNGGGGIGPPLMDSEWKYGGDPASIFASIVAGRPEGMPSFGGHIPEDQVWQIVAYVQSMSGHVRQDVAPSRADSLSPGPPENARPPQPFEPQKPATPPASGAR
jgi:cytochrome c oxidase cbb3-type subunit III